MCTKCNDPAHIAKPKRNRKKMTKTSAPASIADPKILPTIIGKHFGVPLLHGAYKTLLQGAYVTKKAMRLEEHALLYKGDITNLPKDAVPLIRINSACFTGDIFHDLSCDCNWQFEESLRILDQQDGPGVVLYHFAHEGKAHGYFEKLKAYDGTMYPVHSDARDFGHAVAILLDLGFTRVRVMTNNPEKQQILRDHGIEIVETVPIVSTDPNVAHLYDYKAKVWGHALPKIATAATEVEVSATFPVEVEVEHTMTVAADAATEVVVETTTKIVVAATDAVAEPAKTA